MKVIFTGGGTLGHIAPAIAVAEALKKRKPDIGIIFVGRKEGAENDAILRAGYDFFGISAQSMERKISKKSLSAALCTLKSMKEAKDLIEKTKPDLVFGTGVYVCFPVMHAAQKRKIPTVLHEANAVFGRACRMLAPHCTRVLLGAKDCMHAAPRGARCEFTGNPTRKEFSEYTREKARRMLGLSEKDTLLISFGGSGGAEKINTAMLDFMQKQDERKRNLYHIHACGKKYYPALAERYPIPSAKNGRQRLYPFIENMALYMHAADLAVCRSGAMTVAELCAADLPAILIPSPNVTNDHQMKNARSLAACGAALLCKESELSNIENLIFETITDRAALKKMRKSLLSCGDAMAADRIADIIIQTLP